MINKLNRFIPDGYTPFESSHDYKNHERKLIDEKEVNNEIKPLIDTIKNSIEVLNDNGRLVVITFHSLEDRAVKDAMLEMEGKCTCPKDLPYCVCNYKSFGKVITKKPILPTKEEMEENSRSRSAKLRIFEKS